MRRLVPLAACIALLSAAPAQAQDGLRLVQPLPDTWVPNLEFASRDSGDAFQRYALRVLAGRQFESGLGVRFGEQQLDLTFHSAGSSGIAAMSGRRLQWSHALGQRGRVGLSLASGYEPDAQGAIGADTRHLTLFGRYWITPAWALSAEAVAHEPGGAQPRHLFRLGLRHRF